MEGFPRLPGLDRRFGEDGGDFREGGVLLHHHPLDRAEVHGAEIGRPVEAGGVGRQLSGAHRVIGGVAVAALLGRPVRLGDAGLQRDNGGGGLGRPGPAGHLQHLGDIGLILFLLLGEQRREIVVAGGQADAALAHIGDVAVGDSGVGGDAQADDGATEAALGGAHQAGQVGVAARAADGGQVGFQRPGVQRLDPISVHV